MILDRPGPQGSLWNSTTSESAWAIRSQRILFKIPDNIGRKGRLCPLACCGRPTPYKNGMKADEKESYRWCRCRCRGGDGPGEVVGRVGKRVIGHGGTPGVGAVPWRRCILGHRNGRGRGGFSVEIPRGVGEFLVATSRHRT